MCTEREAAAARWPLTPRLNCLAAIREFRDYVRGLSVEKFHSLSLISSAVSRVYFNTAKRLIVGEILFEYGAI